MTSSWEIHHFPGCYCPNKVSCSSVSGDTSYRPIRSDYPHIGECPVCVSVPIALCVQALLGVLDSDFGLGPPLYTIGKSELKNPGPNSWTRKRQQMNH